MVSAGCLALLLERGMGILFLLGVDWVVGTLFSFLRECPRRLEFFDPGIHSLWGFFAHLDIPPVWFIMLAYFISVFSVKSLPMTMMRGASSMKREYLIAYFWYLGFLIGQHL